jgi:hypothetical protein
MAQIATTFEQSEQLVSLGVPKETADMHYTISEWSRFKRLHIGKGGSKDIPAWSLKALLDLLPREIEYKEKQCKAVLEITYCGDSNSGYTLCYRYRGQDGGTFMQTNTDIFAAVIDCICMLTKGGYKLNTENK